MWNFAGYAHCQTSVNEGEAAKVIEVTGDDVGEASEVSVGEGVGCGGGCQAAVVILMLVVLSTLALVYMKRDTILTTIRARKASRSMLINDAL